MNINQLIEKRDIMRGQIQMMQDQDVVDFDGWLHLHAAYGAVLFQIEEITNPLRLIREVK